MDPTSPIDLCDFRQPRRPSSHALRTIERWLRDACQLIAERWHSVGLSAATTYVGVRSQQTTASLLSLPEPGWGVHARFGAVPIDSIVASTLPLLHALAGQVLGEDEADSELDTPLTAIEESMAELLLQEWLAAVGEAWPGAESLDTRLIETIAQPQRSRIMPQREAMLVITLQVAAGATTGEILWLLPREALEDLIEIECRELPAEPVTPDPQLPHIVRQIPVSLTVELGRVDLSMVELTSLEVDDVLVLDQAAAHPVVAWIGEARKFRGRPARIGQRRCLQIDEVLDAADAPLTSSQEA